MGKLLANKGYTLVSLLITLSLIAVIPTLFTIHYVPYCSDYLDLYYDALYVQSLALVDHQKGKVNPVDSCNMDDLYYFENGIVNKAQTIQCQNRQLIIHLGSGNIHVK